MTDGMISGTRKCMAEVSRQGNMVIWCVPCSATKCLLESNVKSTSTWDKSYFPKKMCLVSEALSDPYEQLNTTSTAVGLQDHKNEEQSYLHCNLHQLGVFFGSSKLVVEWITGKYSDIAHPVVINLAPDTQTCLGSMVSLSS